MLQIASWQQIRHKKGPCSAGVSAIRSSSRKCEQIINCQTSTDVNSNLVAFYYGNLTHPSVDPPRIGFMSMVPNNADALLQNDIAQAKADGGNFESASVPSPSNAWI